MAKKNTTKRGVKEFSANWIVEVISGIQGIQVKKIGSNVVDVLIDNKEWYQHLDQGGAVSMVIDMAFDSKNQVKLLKCQAQKGKRLLRVSTTVEAA